MKNFSFKLIVLFNILFFWAAASCDPVNAAESKAGPMMQVAPVIEELSLEPTNQIDKTISVTNQSDQSLKVRVYVAPYSASANSDISDFNSQTEYTQLSHWIKIVGADSSLTNEAEFTINARKTLDIVYRINVPESAPGGSQHACVFIETVPEETTESSTITTVSRMAVKVFAEVSGESIRDVEILGLNASNTFVIGGKAKALATVKNIGNVDIKPTLTLKITNLSDETVFNNTDIITVFPENSGELSLEWSETPAFGIYNLVASLNLLGKNQIIKKTIFILPVWFIFLLLVIIVAIFVVVIRFYKIRKMNRRRKIASRK